MYTVQYFGSDGRWHDDTRYDDKDAAYQAVLGLAYSRRHISVRVLKPDGVAVYAPNAEGSIDIPHECQSLRIRLAGKFKKHLYLLWQALVNAIRGFCPRFDRRKMPRD